MIKFSQKDGIGILYLNRPEKRNALHPVMVEELKAKLAELENDEEIKIVIITGEGKDFCAGADLSYLRELRNNSLIANEKDSESLGELFLQLYKFSKPLIAAVNGAAIAGGCGLANVCDFTVANNNSGFGFPEVKIGFVPAMVSIFLMKRIGEGRAKSLLLSGDIIDGKRAHELGIADYLSDDVMGGALKLSERLLNNSQSSMKMTKQMMQSVSGFNVDEALEYLFKLNTLSRTTNDFIEGLNNFLNKK